MLIWPCWSWLIIGNPYRVRDRAIIFEPTHKKREPLSKHGVHALRKGSLKCLRGTHLVRQVQKDSSHTAFGGGFFFAIPAGQP